MPFETVLVVSALIVVFAFFMALLAWAERRAGGSFDDELREKGTAAAGDDRDTDQRRAA